MPDAATIYCIKHTSLKLFEESMVWVSPVLTAAAAVVKPDHYPFGLLWQGKKRRQEKFTPNVSQIENRKALFFVLAAHSLTESKHC